MNVYVRKWGNSAAVRLPASALAMAGIRADDEVTVRGEEGRIVIEKASRSKKDLQQLIDAITPENRHDETEWGAPTGREYW